MCSGRFTRERNWEMKEIDDVGEQRTGENIWN
jgi:hypothetical protein